MCALQDKEERRALGLVLLRGECVISIAVESPPPPKDRKRPVSALGAVQTGRTAPLGRGANLSAPAPGLAGPIAAMQPQMSANPQMYQQAPPYGRGGPVPMAPYGRGMAPPPAYGVGPPGRMGPPSGYGRGMVR